jgi:hypothetical protein
VRPTFVLRGLKRLPSELVIVVHLYPVGDAALTSPSRSLASVIGVARESKA